MEIAIEYRNIAGWVARVAHTKSRRLIMPKFKILHNDPMATVSCLAKKIDESRLAFPIKDDRVSRLGLDRNGFPPRPYHAITGLPIKVCRATRLVLCACIGAPHNVDRIVRRDSSSDFRHGF